jgi:hypothetical protein
MSRAAHTPVLRGVVRVLALASALGPACPLRAATCFTDASLGLPGVTRCFSAWGDYDNDGDLDLLLGAGAFTRIYRSSGGTNPTFVDIATGLPGFDYGSGSWADYDRDGDLDVLLTGFGAGGPLTQIYRNNGGPNPTFTNALLALPGIAYSAAAWGDYDNDGDPDLLLTGLNNAPASISITGIYRNSGGPNPTFSDAGIALPAARDGSVAWGDYDNDGDLDFLITGYHQSDWIVKLFRNGGGPNPTFAEAAVLPSTVPIGYVSVAWGDFDNDGDLDVVATGGYGPNSDTGVFTNVSSAGQHFFTDDTPTFGQGVQQGSAAWGDYDNDGSRDILFAGYDGIAPQAKVFRRNGGTFFPVFEDIAAGLPGVGNNESRSASGWGDYDNDGDLDILLTGDDSSPGILAAVYRNACSTANTPPQAPTGLSATLNGSRGTFQWNAATDNETPSGGLTYNLRIGTTPGAGDVLAPEAGPSGFRRVVAMGNTQHMRTWEIEPPGPGPFYWSVQAIDGAYAGSPFATESVLGNVTGVPTDPVRLGPGFRLVGPNPFRETVQVELTLANAARASLRVHDAAGRLVRTLLSGEIPQGGRVFSWDGRDDSGRTVPAGIYFVRVETPTGGESSLKVLLAR